MIPCALSARPWGCHGVPRATTALMKMTDFLAQATSVTFPSFL